MADISAASVTTGGPGDGKSIVKRACHNTSIHIPRFFPREFCCPGWNFLNWTRFCTNGSPDYAALCDFPWYSKWQPCPVRIVWLFCGRREQSYTEEGRSWVWRVPKRHCTVPMLILYNCTVYVLSSSLYKLCNHHSLNLHLPGQRKK